MTTSQPSRHIKEEQMNITLERDKITKHFSRNRRAPMNKLLSIAALLFASLLCAQAGPDGHWEADLKGESPQPVRVTLDLAKNAKSEWIGSMGLPSENRTGLLSRMWL